MSLDYLPEGISEAQFVEIVDRVSAKSAAKFLFGYHSIEDHKQHAYVLAITFLKEGKFKPRGDKPMELQLANFLRVWIHNRLSNYRRDNSCRYPNNGGANQIKFNLAHPIHIHTNNLSNSEIFARGSELPERLSREEIFDRIQQGLKPRLRRLYQRYVEGEVLEDEDMEKLMKAIRKVLPGEAEDYI